MRRPDFGLLGRLRRDRRGAILIKATIAFLPLLSISAVAMDFGRIVVIKQKLTNAVDAAALAVGGHSNLDNADAVTLANAFINAHYTNTDVGNLSNVAVTSTATEVDITATARVPTVFLAVFNAPYVDITVSSRALRQQRNIELVMVLDNSGQMAGIKLTNLKSAAHTLVDMLFSSASGAPNVKIGLVPFAAAVNIGTNNTTWLDQTGLSPISREDINVPSGYTLLTLAGSMTNSGWGGCVRARVGPNGYDLTDDPPNPLVWKTLFVPYFAPDEPGTGNGPPAPEVGYDNDYLDDTLIAPAGQAYFVTRQRNGSKYIGAAVLAPGYGPSFNCVAAPIQPLTNVKATIGSAIDAMAAGGDLVISEGLAWGWRVLSPRSPSITDATGATGAIGASYADTTTIKILVLLTDGANSVTATNNLNNSEYSAYGYAASGWLGATDGSQMRQVLDAKTASLCTNIKGDKNLIAADHYIYVYTISYNVTDSAAQTLLRNCATPATDCLGGQCYFDSSSVSSLQDVFASVALEINQLRLAR
jgi:Flp pilus assembly protein TadG